MLANFVQEVANAPGAATTINLAGPPTGRRGFLAAFASGASVYYFMDDGTQSEWGIGTVTSGTPNTLSRTTVISNSAGTTARLNFTGSVRVYNEIPAEMMVDGRWADVASAATVNLGAAISANVRITGTTTITSFGTAPDGLTRDLRFAGALTLTHNATSLILPGGANIATMAGDTARAKSLGGGNWVVVEYTPAALWSWQMVEPPRVVTSVAQVDFALPTAFRRFRLSFHDATVTTTGQQFRARFSSDGGATFLSTANYVSHGLYQVNVVGMFNNASVTSIDLTATISSDARAIGAVEIFPGGSTAKATLLSNWRGVENSVPIHAVGQYGGVWDGASARMNALRIFAASGNVTGTFILEGLR